MGTNQSLPLFDDTTLRAIQPSGNAWIISEDDPATVPVPLQIVIVNVDGPYTERDRKLWTFLLHAKFDKLGVEPLHEIAVREINTVFRELGGQHDSKWIWESARRLAKTTIEWEYTLGDERFQGISSIFGAILTKDARSTGRLHFHFPPLLIPILKEPMRFARLRVHFLIKLSGKYAVTLYEILEGFANRRDGQCRVTISELRKWLKVPPEKYKDWKNFRHRVLEPALKQINDDPLGAGFSVKYTALRDGRFYHEIIFEITKTQARAQHDGRRQRIAQVKRHIDEATAAGRPALLPQHIEKAANRVGHFLDMKVVEKEFWEHWYATGCPRLDSIEGTFIGFTKRKYKQYRQEQQSLDKPIED